MPLPHSFIQMARRTALAGAALVCAATAACGARSPAPPTALPTVRVVTVATSPTPPASPTTLVEPTVPLATAPPESTADTNVTAAPTALPAPSATESRPTPDAQGQTRPVRLPILMYHYVEPWPEEADEIRRGLTVKTEDFAAQMDYLHDHGYVTVSLYDLADAMALGKPLPAKAVVLTFDDGYRSLMDQVVPVLTPFGYTGTIFVVTQFTDDNLPEYITWQQAEALYAQGWKIEPHTKTHDQLEGRGRDFQLYQMLGSIETVQAHTGSRPRFFNYPSGKYDELTVELARELNLWGAVTVNYGVVHTWKDRYDMTRVRVSGTAGLNDFIFALEGDLP